MSFLEWKEEYYPTEANSKMSTKEAIIHSLRKWEGLRAENLRKHGLRIIGQYIVEGAYAKIMVTSSTCALCELFLREVYEGDEVVSDECERCPLYNVLGGNPCDAFVISPYQQFIRSYNPEPMIAALQEALRRHLLRIYHKSS